MIPHSFAETDRPLRADARRNRERILEAARAVFAELGPDAQMDDLARRAGVGVGTVYRHFPTKDALMAELVRQKLSTQSEAARAALSDKGEPFEVLANVLRSGAEMTARDAAVQHALLASGMHIWAQAGAEQQELAALTGTLVERAQRAGSMRADVTVDDIPMLMCGVSATMSHPRAGFDWRRHLELVIDALRA